MKDGTLYTIAAASLQGDFTRACGTKEHAYHSAKVESRTFSTNTARKVAFGDRNRHDNPSPADLSYEAEYP